MFQLLLQYLLGDDDVQRERKENSKSQFLFAKTRSGARNFTIENGEKERKKERKIKICTYIYIYIYIFSIYVSRYNHIKDME